MNSSQKFFKYLIQQSQLSSISKYGFRVHFLKGPAAEQMCNSSEQQQLFDIICKNQKENSYLIFNPEKTEQKIREWKENMEWIKPFYAIKANPSDQQLEIMKRENIGFDCASANEMKRVLCMGVNPNRIILSNSVKKLSDLKYASQQKVNLTTADTIDELFKIRANHPACEILWRIAIPELHSQQLATTFSHKFGDDLLNSQQIQSRFKEIKDLGFNIAGIHFHCGSGVSGSQNFGFALEIVQECLKIGRDKGHQMRLLDLGGGFPSGSIPIGLIQQLQILKKDQQLQTVMAEPGRHLASNSFDLVCNVIGKRRKQGHLIYHINESVYHMMNCTLMDGISLGRNEQAWYASWEHGGCNSGGPASEIGTLVGMTCDGQDIIAKNISLPEMNVGDSIVINGMGAYTLGPVSRFNGMDAEENVIVNNINGNNVIPSNQIELATPAVQ